MASNFLPRAFPAANACFDDAVLCATGWRVKSSECEVVFCAYVALARELVDCSSTSFCQLCCGQNTKVHSRFEILAVSKQKSEINRTK